MTDEIVTLTESETAAAGQRLASRLDAGAVVLLFGNLGAGKTAFVRGMARGVAAPEDEVSSPTFTLVQEYRGRVTLYHVDLYRLAPAEVDDLGLDELIESGGVVAIEWADRWPGRPRDAIEVHLEDIGGDQRRITIAHRAEPEVRISRPGPPSG